MQLDGNRECDGMGWECSAAYRQAPSSTASNTASNPALAKAPPAIYYLALGDSLAQGGASARRRPAALALPRMDSCRNPV